MSAPSPGASWQSAELASSYFDRRNVLVPFLQLQEDVIRELLARHGRAVERVLDIGSGDGALSELVLTAHPEAESVLVDFSAPMLEQARVRLAELPGRWQTITADLNDPSWIEAPPAGRYDAIVSGLAIHHLPSDTKRTLFAQLFELLEPGGIFVNMDYVSIEGPLRGRFDEEMLAKAVQHERDLGGHRSHEEVDLEDDDDRPDSAEQQVLWLREAGFEQAEVHFKWAEAAVFGAVRPANRR